MFATFKFGSDLNINIFSVLIVQLCMT